MGTVVIKLGSSIVADDRGEVRRDVLEQVCDQVAELHHRGDAVIAGHERARSRAACG